MYVCILTALECACGVTALFCICVSVGVCVWVGGCLCGGIAQLFSLEAVYLCASYLCTRTIYPCVGVGVGVGVAFS